MLISSYSVFSSLKEFQKQYCSVKVKTLYGEKVIFQKNYLKL